MAEVELKMPAMGESVAEATIIKWLFEEGDAVSMDESLLEIATDKVDSEIHSEVDGILSKKLFADGDIIKVGEVIAIITTNGKDEAKPKTITTENKSTPTPRLQPPSGKKPIKESSKPSVDKTDSNIFLSPLVKNIALKEGISHEELNNINGSGLKGRITKADILAYIKDERTSTKTAIPKASVSTPPAAVKSMNNEDEVIAMDRMRKMIADHMVNSKNVAAHVTSFVEADVTNIVTWRDSIKEKFEKDEGEKFTFMPIFIEVLTRALKEFPILNSSIEGDNIIKHKKINIGMATALPNDNLIVPVIKEADTLNLLGLSKRINDLANRARTGGLTPEEIQGSTYTITNVGSFGNVMGTPIINQPEVAILAVGSITKKPAVIETEEGDTIGIRHFMYLSHSFDHRIIDGSLGGRFVKRVAELLEQWDVNRII